MNLDKSTILNFASGRTLQMVGIGLLVTAFGSWMWLLFGGSYTLTEEDVRNVLSRQEIAYLVPNDEARELLGDSLYTSFDRSPQLRQAEGILLTQGYIDQRGYDPKPDLSALAIDSTEVNTALPQIEQLLANEAGILGETYRSQFTFVSDLKAWLATTKASYDDSNYIAPGGYADWQIAAKAADEYTLEPLTSAAGEGYLSGWRWLWLIVTVGFGIVGTIVYNLPKLRKQPGIDNDHVFHSKMHHRGWVGIATGVFLIAFYILLYFYPEYITNWIDIMDPVSQAISGNAASKWFMYGFLYTLCIAVMGVRMLIKYRHNQYQIVRTISVMFFQTAFAFIIPEILVALNKPYYDFKNIWPLDYDFFFDWQLNEFLQNGTLGYFMLFWGIVLFAVAVPVLVYFFGKRWYCSWVCGCGGLAETLGDPYRHLSDKSLKAWKIERWLVHGVLVFAIVMTIAVLYSYLAGANRLYFMAFVTVAASGLGIWLARQDSLKVTAPKYEVYSIGGVALGIVALMWWTHLEYGQLFLIDPYAIRSYYGFLIGSIFAGVVGTGFYPFMGNRVWCRFGCPLAAYLGLVQRFKSRFRITSNGSQCISCGNCSTYCEMGIDVRWYAQRGQDVVRASCVGCGICAAVCPRGVLRLENAAGDLDQRTKQKRAFHVEMDL